MQKTVTHFPQNPLFLDRIAIRVPIGKNPREDLDLRRPAVSAKMSMPSTSASRCTGVSLFLSDTEIFSSLISVSFCVPFISVKDEKHRTKQACVLQLPPAVPKF